VEARDKGRDRVSKPSLNGTVERASSMMSRTQDIVVRQAGEAESPNDEDNSPTSQLILTAIALERNAKS
jgi:hypothetical protein